MTDSFSTRDVLDVNGKRYQFASLAKLGQRFDLKRLPYSMKILLENLLRHEDGINVTAKEIEAVANWDASKEPDTEIAFMPARVRAAGLHRRAVRGRSRRDARCDGEARRRCDADQSAVAGRTGHRPFGAGRRVRQRRARSTPTSRSNSSATRSATASCAGARRRFDNFKVVPPRTGIVHQVNLEYLARVVMTCETGRRSCGRIRTPCSAPIRTRRWSTASACSAGASAASRRKPRCSASRRRC